LARNPDTVRSPDAAFIRQDRVPVPRPIKFFEGSPDLAVEVVSPSDTVDEVDDTVQTWLEAGALDVVVINPRKRTIKLIEPGGKSKTLRPGDTLEGLASLPGFRCAVADIFA
jgi:Uma2 family endonuclease